MHIHDFPLIGKNFQDILFYMLTLSKLFQEIIFLDQHNRPKKYNWLQEESLRIQICAINQNISHEHLLN